MWILFLLYNKLINILFPKRCFCCHKDGEPICNNCIKNFSRSVDSPEQFIYPYFSYRDTKLKSVMHATKYYHRKDLLIPIIISTLSNVKNIINDKKDYLLVPIPMHSFRKAIRGYNQAEIIAKEYSKALNIPYSTKILYRDKLTVRQVKSKNRNERIKNQKGSFVLKNFDGIKGKTIILIDDVTTTGATIEETRNLFLKNNFKDVIAITLAH